MAQRFSGTMATFCRDGAGRRHLGPPAACRFPPPGPGLRGWREAECRDSNYQINGLKNLTAGKRGREHRRTGRAYTYASLTPLRAACSGTHTYAFDVDFDLMLTNWAQAADEILENELAGAGAEASAISGLERETQLLMARRIAEQLAPRDRPRALCGLSRWRNAHRVPSFTLRTRVTLHPSLDRGDRRRTGRQKPWVRAGRKHGPSGRGLLSGTLVLHPGPHLLESAEEGRASASTTGRRGSFLRCGQGKLETREGRRVDGTNDGRGTTPTARPIPGVERRRASTGQGPRVRDPFVPVGARRQLFARMGGSATDFNQRLGERRRTHGGSHDGRIRRVVVALQP